jgi:FAD synthase
VGVRHEQEEESIESSREWLNRKASTKGKMVHTQSDRQVGLADAALQPRALGFHA